MDGMGGFAGQSGLVLAHQTNEAPSLGSPTTDGLCASLIPLGGLGAPFQWTFVKHPQKCRLTLAEQKGLMDGFHWVCHLQRVQTKGYVLGDWGHGHHFPSVQLYSQPKVAVVDTCLRFQALPPLIFNADAAGDAGSASPASPASPASSALKHDPSSASRITAASIAL